MENKIINQCKKCDKKYKSKTSLEKHEKKCKANDSKPSITIEETEKKENNYDVNMTFLEGNKVAVEVTKQDDDEDGEQVLKEILKPKVSPSYQQEIDKLQDLIEMFKTLPIPEKAESKDLTISQLKNIIAILMTQSQNLIKEMKQMSRRNSYFKNNIMLASFVLDKCRREVPESEEEFENMFT
jgi:hypothetical protein|uniref:C2H2-type domain-containing protein n=1 Tax=viral metagenome TaxID=1070528 RepID=A0A6C0CIY4_9ZZZZ